MEFILGVFIVGFGAAVLVGLVSAIGIMLGFPMERQKTVDKRQVVAQQMWQEKLDAEAARNVAKSPESKRLVTHHAVPGAGLAVRWSAKSCRFFSNRN